MPNTPTRSSMTIGAFSQLSRLSIKALRLYDSLGLLPPAWIDAESGYRYYDPAQLERARQISLLRQLDLPLSAIAEVLDAPSAERRKRFEHLWQGVEAAHTQRRELAEYLLSQVFKDQDSTDQRSLDMTQTAMHIDQSADSSFTLQQRFVPQRRVVSITRRVFVNDLKAFFEDSGRVLAFVEQQGAQMAGPMFAVYHGEVNNDSDGPVEICFPYSGELAAEGEFALRDESAHHEAYVTLTKAQFEFPQILKAYDAALSYAQQLGECSQFAPREVYNQDWNMAGPNDLVADVAWPFVPEGQG
ncbi:MerR family transcriptional regulator [Deinococcus detaillensis]|uniref:MerR family transcriptional regulator n=1 Tax=Deinococcus detaillensis TaxID=2592048 RepID=A0A553UQD0_9DEIO|nr:helix-turn-helix domain-containing protein [Deinococcus detaillensis]TSA82426.1 MerR family transcriptional regulator [Deinococcus detaillensis]